MHPGTAATVIASITLASVGCGGSSKAVSLTNAELIAKTNTICARFNVKYHAHGSTTFQDFARNVPLLAQYEHTVAAELRTLRPPASLANDWKQMVDDEQTLANDTSKIVPYAKENKLSAVIPLMTMGQHIQQQLVAIAKRDGFSEICE
jgi:hypothetical protein